MKRIGYPVCLGTNEILCKNDWKFGIIRTGYGNQTKSHLELRRGNTDNNRIPDLVYRKFPTANTLCIAEYPQNLAILSVGGAGGTCATTPRPRRAARRRERDAREQTPRHSPAPHTAARGRRLARARETKDRTNRRRCDTNVRAQTERTTRKRRANVHAVEITNRFE